MERNNYDYEARYIQVIQMIRNWRRACDERGLSQITRCKFNYELLNFILDELMPWYKVSWAICFMCTDKCTQMIHHIVECQGLIDSKGEYNPLVMYMNVLYVTKNYYNYCRSLDGICGFSRETTIALTTNIESCEWKRRELAILGEKGENPRASTT